MSYDKVPEHKFTGSNPGEMCGHISAEVNKFNSCYQVYTDFEDSIFLFSVFFY